MGSTRIWPILTTLVVATWVLPPLGGRPVPSCAGGHFRVDAGPAMPGPIVLYDGTLSVSGFCPPAATVVTRRSRAGTTLRAAWPACHGLAGLRMRIRIDDTCGAMSGVVRVRGLRQSFHARRVPACGDGMREGDETCDDGNTLDGDCCTATCQRDRRGACPV